VKYSEYVIERLATLGYTECYFVAGGNSMHLLDAARRRMRCVPYVHEVSAAIAAEYFNEVSDASSRRAFVLVTAGPGLTNAVTALAGAYLESRELLVLGGQVKTSDLATDGLRQRGIQEVDGVAIARPVTKLAVRLETPVIGDELDDLLQMTSSGRPGPVFLEICLDVQANPIDDIPAPRVANPPSSPMAMSSQLETLTHWISESSRPVLLLGGGISRNMKGQILDVLNQVQIPTMTTWNGADRLESDHPLYFGRPNTWGQRSSNIILQQADLVIALGSRLGLQQTGFNWQAFAPLARVVQVDIDDRELTKGHPQVNLSIYADANAVLTRFSAFPAQTWPEWTNFAREVRALLPLSEDSNFVADPYINTYDFVEALSNAADSDDVIIPCSSGGAFTVMMQAFQQRAGQQIVTNKGLASMGYGLAGAIGASMARPASRVILVEGDGGFSQNLQELATVRRNNLNLKILIFANNGYASIRMTQSNYFNGEYLGCDTATGLGFPEWQLLATTYGLDFAEVGRELWHSPNLAALWNSPNPALLMVPIDPAQTYFPKISSRVTASGSMESAPLHLMSPDLPEKIARRVMRYLPS
jgi:acetolactate synthase-1/2/3 large subunit